MRTFIPCLSAPPPPPPLPPPAPAPPLPASHFCLAAHLRFFARVQASVDGRERAFERTVTDSSERLIHDESREPLGIGLIAAL